MYIYIYNLSAVQGAVPPKQMPTRRRNSAMSIYINICVNWCVNIYIFHMSVFIYKHIYIYMLNVQMCMYIYIYIYLYMSIYIHTTFICKDLIIYLCSYIQFCAQDMIKGQRRFTFSENWEPETQPPGLLQVIYIYIL